MADFCNGETGDRAEVENCNRCVHEENSEGNGCRVMLLHLEWNDYASYKEARETNETVGSVKRHALDTLWPMVTLPHGKFPGRCAMFHEKRIAELERPRPDATPTDFVLMPVALTAENGAKAMLSGEFTESVDVECLICAGDGSGLHGSGVGSQAVPVAWTTIKAIYAMAVEHLAEQYPAALTEKEIR